MNQRNEFSRRKLPHWYPENATYFVTIRLAGSLPQEVIAYLITRRSNALNALKTAVSPEEYGVKQDDVDKRFFDQWDTALASTKSSVCWLSKPEIAKVVADALLYRDTKIFHLWAYCIMSNHAHIVFTPKPQQDGGAFSFSKIMHSYKRFTARECNKLLNRTGPFWQHESYDRVVRNQGELARVIHYVINNPVKAGLVLDPADWPWTYCVESY